MQHFETVILQLGHSVAELKRIARHTFPEDLLNNGLDAALHELCRSLENNVTIIEFRASGMQKALPVLFQANIFLIIREILYNAVEHAQAATIIVLCSQQNNSFFITVEDNGKGFDIAAANSENAAGLAIVKNRVRSLQGKINISSEINKGTTFTIELDLPE